MNDGRFDKVNAQRQQIASRKKAKADLLKRLEAAKTFDDLKAILALVISRLPS